MDMYYTLRGVLLIDKTTIGTTAEYTVPRSMLKLFICVYWFWFCIVLYSMIYSLMYAAAIIFYEWTGRESKRGIFDMKIVYSKGVCE